MPRAVGAAPARLPAALPRQSRLWLGVEVRGGKDHAARHGLPGLWERLDALPRTHWPAFLRGVARQTAHRGQRTVKVSLQHENGDLLAKAITAVSNTLQRLNAIAERWTIEQRWSLLLTHIFRRWLGGKWLGELPPQATLFLSG